MSDRELCYSTSKAIGDEEDTLKSFMTFDITPCEPVFKVVVGSQIVVLLTIPPSQWHFRNLNLWPWLWYHLLDCELCHSTSKPIDDEKDTQIFYGFRHHTMRVCFRVTVGSQIVVPQQLIYIFFTTTFSSSICICYLRIEALFFVIWDLLLKNRFLFSFDIYMPIIHACMSFFFFFSYETTNPLTWIFLSESCVFIFLSQYPTSRINETCFMKLFSFWTSIWNSYLIHFYV